MTAGSTYTPIATTTLGSAVPSYTFNSISSIYTDLILIANANVDVDNAIALQFNGDTASNYSRVRLYGNGTSGASTKSSNDTELRFSAGDANAQPCTWIHHIMNYASTAMNKTVLTNSAQDLAELNVGLWRSTSAINSIKILSVSGANFVIGSTFTLYGLAAA